MSDAHQGPAIAYKDGVEIGRVPYHIREAEKRIIYDYLVKHGGNKTKAAEALGVSHRHLQRRCVALGVAVGFKFG